MDLITLDFETYFDPDYSLSKMTTLEDGNYNDFEAIAKAVLNHLKQQGVKFDVRD